MSSKEQYKDLIKRLNQEIRDLKKENSIIKAQNNNLIKAKFEAIQVRNKSIKKKWYQFWK